MSRRQPIDKPPLKVLLVASGPTGHPIEYDKVREAIESPGKDLIQVTALLPSEEPGIASKATWKNFTAMLENDEFHVVHFLGHGKWDSEKKAGTILFMRKDDTDDPRSEGEIATTLMGLPSLHLVFLQACESAESDPYQAFSGVAQQLAQKAIPAVVGMQTKINQQVANQFASAFYVALANKLTVDAALQTARRTILDESSDSAQRLGFGLPVLYLRESEPLFAPAGPTSPQTISEFVTCVWCGERNKPTDKFCAKCDGALSCFKCKISVDRPRASCGQCGEPLRQPRTDYSAAKLPPAINLRRRLAASAIEDLCHEHCS